MSNQNQDTHTIPLKRIKNLIHHFIAVVGLVSVASLTNATETARNRTQYSNDRDTHGPQTVDDGMIQRELACVADAVGGGGNVECFGEGFEKAWSRLAEKGIDFPSKSDREHFWAQIFHESGRLKNLSQDGKTSRWKGRGPIQLTHCANYVNFARFVRSYESDEASRLPFSVQGRCRGNKPPTEFSNDPVIRDPESVLGERSRSCEMQALSAIWWWENQKKHVGAFRRNVESQDVKAVTKNVNGGTIGLSERKSFHAKIQQKRCVR